MVQKIKSTKNSNSASHFPHAKQLCNFNLAFRSEIRIKCSKVYTMTLAF